MGGIFLEILIAFPLQDEDRKNLLDAAPEMTFTFCDRWEDISPETAKKTEILFGNIPPAVLSSFPHLKWLQTASAGFDKYLDTEDLPKDLLLTGASGAYGENISEYMLCAVLNHFQNFHRMRDNQKKSLWKDEGLAKNILNSTVIIVGTGNIGSEFAKRIHLLGASRIIGFRRNVSAKKPEFFDEIYSAEDIDPFLSIADIIASTLPASFETMNFFDRTRIFRFKKDAVFVNVGRGTTVDLDALCDAVDSGILRGATLDVTDPEPLPPSHRAWSVENLIITPHVAGGFRDHLLPTSGNCISLKNILKIFLSNLNRFQKGEPLHNIVPHSVGR